MPPPRIELGSLTYHASALPLSDDGEEWTRRELNPRSSPCKGAHQPAGRPVFRGGATGGRTRISAMRTQRPPIGRSPRGRGARGGNRTLVPGVSNRCSAAELLARESSAMGRAGVEPARLGLQPRALPTELPTRSEHRVRESNPSRPLDRRRPSPEGQRGMNEGDAPDSDRDELLHKQICCHYISTTIRMPRAGFEPARRSRHEGLSLACLPFQHLGGE
jgi:hypothetical protein